MRWSETNSCFSQRPFAAVTMKTKRKNPNTYKYPDFLMHYGIKGQQWGLRRFQNEDGSLTEEGKLRYNEGKPESEEWRKNEAEHLTDAELRRRNNRLQMERQYKDLMTTESEREAKQRRKDIINKVIIGTGVSLAAVAMRGHWKQAASFISNFAKKKFAPYRAAGMLRSTLKKSYVPNQEAFNTYKISGKHVGQIAKNLISKPGKKIYENGIYANPILRKRAYWRGL